MSREKIAWILPFLVDLRAVAQQHDLRDLARDLEAVIARHGCNLQACDPGLCAGRPGVGEEPVSNVVQFAPAVFSGKRR